MVEEQIEIVVLSANLKRILAADESEALAELKDEGAEMIEEAALELPFGLSGPSAKKSKL